MKESRSIHAGLLLVVGVLIAVAGWFWVRSPKTVPAPSPVSVGPSRTGPQPHVADRRVSKLGSIAGRVADSTGTPLPAALVCAAVASSPTSPGHGDPTCVSAGNDGRYQLTNLPSARLTVVASAPGHRPVTYTAVDRSRFLQLGDGEARTDVDFTLPVGGVKVTGHVKDVGGGGIGGALVMISGWPGTLDGAVFTRSGDGGLFSAWIEEGRYTASATADGYAEGRKDGVAPGAAIEVLLTPGAVLVGRVIEAVSGVPVAGATVNPGMDQGWPSPASSVTSDDDGRFRVTGLQPGRYKPTARSFGGFGQARESVLLGVAQTSREVTIELHPAGSVVGRVLIAPGDAPCSNGAVVLVDGARGGMLQAAIESDGTARFEGTPPGSYRVMVHCQDHAAEPTYPPVLVGNTDLGGLVWTVRVGLSVHGRVVDPEGKPVRATVYASAVAGGFGPPVAFAQNDDDGRFVLRGLRPGKVRLMANAKDHVPPQPVEVDLVDAHTPEVTIVVEAGGGVAGRVTDEDNRPIAGADIMVMGQMPQFRPPITSLEDGTFAVKGLGAGDYRVWATQGGAEASSPGGGASAASVTVKAGDTSRVALVLKRQRGEIRGRVVDDSGEPVTDAFVDANRESANPGTAPVPAIPWARPHTPVLTDASGEFALEHLSEGTYAVHAYRKGGGTASIEGVKVGTTVTLTIQKTGAISGTVEVPGTGPSEQFTIRAVGEAARLFRSESFLHSGGAWTLGELPEGTYRLSADAPEGTATAEVTLARGEHRANVALSLASRATIHGQVVSLDDSTPVVGVGVRAFARHGMAGGTPGQEQVVTDATGRFQLEGVPSGEVMLFAIPSDPMTSEHDAALVPVDVSPGRGNDVGRILIAKRRVKRGELPGDLGYTCQPPASIDFASGPNLVDAVRPDGPAAATELRVGDVIVAVDGHDVTGKMSYLYRSLATVAPGTEVTLGLARGTNVTIVAVKQTSPRAIGSGLAPSLPPPAP